MLSIGLRQGDLIFILCVGVISYILFYSPTEGKLKAIKISRYDPEITHNLFANDLILFGRATRKVAKVMLECLEAYCSWFGQNFDPSKLAIYFSRNTPPAKAIDINAILGFQRKKTARNLGLLLFHGKVR